MMGELPRTLPRPLPLRIIPVFHDGRVVQGSAGQQRQQLVADDRDRPAVGREVADRDAQSLLAREFHQPEPNQIARCTASGQALRQSQPSRWHPGLDSQRLPARCEGLPDLLDQPAGFLVQLGSQHLPAIDQGTHRTAGVLTPRHRHRERRPFGRLRHHRLRRSHSRWSETGTSNRSRRHHGQLGLPAAAGNRVPGLHR